MKSVYEIKSKEEKKGDGKNCNRITIHVLYIHVCMFMFVYVGNGLQWRDT